MHKVGLTFKKTWTIVTLSTNKLHKLMRHEKISKGKPRTWRRQQRALWKRHQTGIGKNRYWMMMTPDGRKYEHRVICEELLGRPLTRQETIIHIDGDGLNNTPTNLSVISKNYVESVYSTTTENIIKAPTLLTWSRFSRYCVTCKGVDHPHACKGECRPCYSKQKNREPQNPSCNIPTPVASSDDTTPTHNPPQPWQQDPEPSTLSPSPV